MREARSKIPILGDLLILGGLFRTKQTIRTKTDLFVFITPRILSRTGHLPEAEEAKTKQQFLGPEHEQDCR